jgi:hypothetical protein
LTPIFANAVESIAEQINKFLSINPDISLNLGHKANADRFTAMNGHNRAPPIGVLHNRMTPSLPHKLETGFPQRSDHMGTRHTRHSVHTDIL